MTIFILSILSISLLMILYFSIRKNIELLDKLQLVDDSLQTCIKLLDIQATKIEEKTKIEVFSDEPIIRDLINDMVTAKETVVKVSSLLDDLVEEQDEIENE